MEKLMDKICEMFHDILHELAAKGTFTSANDVQTAKAAVSGILKIKTLEAMEHYGGNSFRGRSYDGDMSHRSYEGSYDGGSYRRGRGANGQYVSRDGGSMREKLEHLAEEAGGREREMIMEMISKM